VTTGEVVHSNASVLTVTISRASFQNALTIDFGEGDYSPSGDFVGAEELMVLIRVHNRAESNPRDVTVINPDG